MNDKDFYDPQNKGNIPEDEDHTGGDSFFEDRADNLFHIGQSYEDKVAETVYCKHCGGKEFNVGRGNYYTAIKCVKCEWEICIHDG